MAREWRQSFFLWPWDSLACFHTVSLSWWHLTSSTPIGLPVGGTLQNGATVIIKPCLLDSLQLNGHSLHRRVHTLAQVHAGRLLLIGESRATSSTQVYEYPLIIPWHGHCRKFPGTQPTGTVQPVVCLKRDPRSIQS